MRGPGYLGLCLLCIADPEQFDVAVCKKEASARCSLSWMCIGRAFGKTKFRQLAGLRASKRRPDEEVVNFKWHIHAGLGSRLPNDRGQAGRAAHVRLQTEARS